MEPITREEILLNAIASGVPSELKPITREEMFLAKAAGMDVDTPKPITRREMFLSKISDSTGGGGGEYEAMLAGLIDGTVTHITIPEGTTAIRDHTFAGHASMQTVSIPDSVKSIGIAAFLGCNSLKSLVIPDSVLSVSSAQMGSGAFALNSSLERVTLGSGIAELRGPVFQGDTALKTVVFRGKPSMSTASGAYAFYGCTGITDIYVPWAEGEVPGAPWGATNATIHYNHTEG